ncbi:MAG: type II toxin-antitoxin system Phd/YefM family antitoxin [Acidobacteriota bacterium]
MTWKVGEAKQRFSDLLRQAAAEPQLIYNRDRLVAVVVEGGTFEQFRAWDEQTKRRTLAAAFEELRQIESEEDYTLKTPKRRNRRSASAAFGHELSR